ncbi:MAG TPA: trehalase family glycosidase [Clostridia bacterium]|nr:trehalase family glycosidase [Clostridia bacterium]
MFLRAQRMSLLFIVSVLFTGFCTAADFAAFRAASSRPRAADAELRASFLFLTTGWDFRADPNDDGVKQNWHRSFPEDGSHTLRAREVWEKQGFAGYDGVGWYHKDVNIPAEWKGHAVDLISIGVDDEFDLYVNGTLVGHQGDAREKEWGSVSRWRTVTPMQSAVKYGETNSIVLRVKDWGGDGGLWGDIMLRRRVPFAAFRKYLPEPVISRSDWVDLYWKAWEIAWLNIAPGTPENRFAPLYMDEAFNEDVYQWDSVFMTMFGRYGDRLFPSIDTLDNFYQGQRADGYIQRIYLEDNGKIVYEPTADDPNVNPPLFAWAELENYRITGDLARLRRVYPVLARYYRWLDRNTRTPMGNGLYFQTAFGSGMDNVPRADLKKGTWTDASLQMALFARNLQSIAELAGQKNEVEEWRREYERLRKTINRVAWNASDGYYYDVQPDGQPTRVRHIGAFWSLLSGVADDAQVKALVEHLKDPKEFYRPHLFPSLAASDPHYDKMGNYWVGSIWASTNYMTIKGLKRRGYRDLARHAAENHIDNMARVMAADIDESLVNPAERDGDYRSIWECYAPEFPLPGTTWDAKHLSRHHFVGWSGAGPIAMLFEDVLGFEVNAPENKVEWHITRTDEHGVRNMPIGTQDAFDLVAARRNAPDDKVVIESKSTRDYTLVLHVAGWPTRSFQVAKGKSKIELSR